MKKFIFITLIALSCFKMYGQISTREVPVSFKLNTSALWRSENVQKTMPLLDMKKIEQEDKEAEASGLPPVWLFS